MAYEEKDNARGLELQKACLPNYKSTTARIAALMKDLTTDPAEQPNKDREQALRSLNDRASSSALCIFLCVPHTPDKTKARPRESPITPRQLKQQNSCLAGNNG